MVYPGPLRIKMIKQLLFLLVFALALGGGMAANLKRLPGTWHRAQQRVIERLAPVASSTTAGCLMECARRGEKSKGCRRKRWQTIKKTRGAPIKGASKYNRVNGYRSRKAFR